MPGIRQEATEAADEVLAQHWKKKGAVDPARIASSLGIDVVEAYLDADVAGAIERVSGRNPVIYISASDHPNRQRFTCAHEIGHFVERAQQADDFEYIDYRGDTASMGVDSSEMFANAFAAALLMPEDDVRRLHDKGWNESKLARHFGVSQAALVNRLKNLDIYR